jgi:hypothetical protein
VADGGRRVGGGDHDDGGAGVPLGCHADPEAGLLGAVDEALGERLVPLADGGDADLVDDLLAAQGGVDGGRAGVPSSSRRASSLNACRVMSKSNWSAAPNQPVMVGFSPAMSSRRTAV